ncbi:nucleoside-diphosphate kinase [Blattabacterium sp. (Blaberus giganteus)]|uniref:nucleoside-diphosphate kinase n=1 Tax=Blattabacterium sp. (Blaberus giganteus) TaxID=1186051 RepID=UPI00025F6EB9|nr:nucleoside-diphosphate kinase [Blattabacterium sp. (Blaberus giganteus)]AFJ90634.1 nucleoside-diphosphate kinase [Blattabacterium sp. (Blaberus giganteus)]
MIDRMFGKITLSIIKPDAVQKEYVIPILCKIIHAGFHIAALKMTELSKKSAKKFYAEHKNKLFFESLIRFMSSGPIVSVILEKENAVKDFRILIGETNPVYAKKGTIRNLYASSLEKNAIHGSDNNQNALKECLFYFSNREIFLKENFC